jgi:hypothetical protein
MIVHNVLQECMDIVPCPSLLLQVPSSVHQASGLQEEYMGCKWYDAMVLCTGPFISKVELPNHKEPGLNFTVLPGEPMEVRLLRPFLLSSASTLGYEGLLDAAEELVLNGEVSLIRCLQSGHKWTRSAVNSEHRHWNYIL